ncbi:MAG: bifunctional phosphoglucose/phosphomannose isomerase, partial [bacterium]|nr:bifunctional phosphoglucose/phosphomannose isomerase [bacterium]
IAVIAGMGGSHLAADIMQVWDSSLDIVVQSDYGFSGIPGSVLKDSLIVASSYSGNTEETLSVFEEAQKRGLPLAALSTGGNLLELAKKHGVPYAQIPDTGIQPRMALGYMLRGLAALTMQERLLKESALLSKKLRPGEREAKGKELAGRLKGKIPVIYSSRRNQPVAYNWKIKFNESSKIPAFFNVFPELNHNEMTGFDVIGATRELTEKLCVIVLKDGDDHPRVQKRMEELEKLYRDRGVSIESIRLEGDTALEKIFNSLLVADWTALHVAELYGTEPEEVPMVEEFKKRIAG